MNNENDYNFWFWLSVMANCAQLESYKILLNDFDNHDLMHYLQHQDELLNKIIQQNDEIINLLKGEK
jgi:hypothetical protein